MKQVTYINPPSCCDLCKQPIDDLFYDCCIPEYGCWANICPDCFDDHGCKLGTGVGQRYEKIQDGKFVKTAG